ncbi:hypothetical protein ACIHCQ_19410 [Streptomyces sp. NPDC052236]|uniref:hypothetical protein n=1 Tax=Streptomyces sp. NPDC052236 TaxID=3365686 RepID=UPI0037D732DB
MYPTRADRRAACDQVERRIRAAVDRLPAGHQPDPRQARISRLRDINERLAGELARTNTEFTLLKERHRLLLSVLAAKDDELERLRRELSTFAGTHAARSQRRAGGQRSVRSFY